MVQKSEKTYSIGDAEKMTGVSQRMLRAWEENEKYRIKHPEELDPETTPLTFSQEPTRYLESY